MTSSSVKRLLKSKSGIRLCIGGGHTPQPGFVNLDIRKLPEVDIVQDVEDIPWKLPKECVVMAVCSHLVEHINPHKFGFINFMNEMWRVMKVGGELAIACPHGSSQGFLQDPTHCNALNENTWAYFDPGENGQGNGLYSIYTPKPWHVKYLSYDPSANMEVVMVKLEERKPSKRV